MSVFIARSRNIIFYLSARRRSGLLFIPAAGLPPEHGCLQPPLQSGSGWRADPLRLIIAESATAATPLVRTAIFVNC